MATAHLRDTDPVVNSRPQADPDYLAKLKTWQGLPVTVGDLERILGAAGSMPESLDGVPARLFWRALLLLILDTAEEAADLLDLPADAYDRDSGTLRIPQKIVERNSQAMIEAMQFLFRTLADGPRPRAEIKADAKARGISWSTLKRAKGRLGVKSYRDKKPGPWSWRLPEDAAFPDPEPEEIRIAQRIVHLHAHAANALEALRPYQRDRLLPWPKDKGCRPFFMLYHDYQELLHRAGLPPKQKRPLAKLRKLGERYPEVLDCIDPHRPFHPVPGKPNRGRKPKPKRRKPRVPYGVYVVGDNSPDTLRNYFKGTYRPLKLINGSQRTVDTYLTVLNGFASFLACEPTVHHLTDDFLGRYAAWMAGKGYEATTINNHLRHLLAIWRHAWKKKRTEELPRDVDFLAEYKRIPTAWTVEEISRILASARKAEGDFRGIPADLFWPAFLLTMYETGLRLGAMMLLRSQDLDLETGILIARAETQKQKADQHFRLHRQTLESLRAIWPQRREHLFGYPDYGLNKRPLYDQFDAILKRAGLPTTARDKFHKIRRTAATLICNALGEDAAKEHLGHSHRDITRAYLDLTKITPRVNAADVLPRPQMP